jgi:hypothetical protein
MSEVYSVTGTLKDGHIVLLDEKLPVQSARLKMTLEAIPTDPPSNGAGSGGSGSTYLEAITAVRERLRSEGHRPLTIEEVDAYLQGERDSWDDEP